MAKQFAPNDSLQQSTREPSTRLTESVDFSSPGTSKRFLHVSSQIGGGSFKSYMMDHVSRLHADIEATTRKLELEQRRLCKLDKDLEVAEQEHSQKRQRYKIAQNREDDVAHRKGQEVKQLERRLEKAIADLNKALSHNEGLREQIDQLRKERQTLDVVFKQMWKGITANEKEVDRLKSGMNHEKVLAEEAKQKGSAASKMRDKQRKAFQAETERLRNEVQKEAEVQKEHEKLSQTSSMYKTRKNYLVADEEEAFSEQTMHRRILKLSFLNTIQRRHIKQHQKNIEVFEQAFATIKSSTGISDIEEIVKIFIALEQRNFSLLTYVNDLNRDIESIEIRNRDLQNQLETHQLQEKQSTTRKDTALSEVSAQIAKTKAATEEKSAMVADVAAALDECRPLINRIVNFLKEQIPKLLHASCNGDVPQPRQAAPQDYDESLNHHLTFIEEALMQFRACLPPESVSVARSLPQAKTFNASGAKKPTELPSAHLQGEESDDDPEAGAGDRPWTRSELRDRAQAMIARRRKKPGQQGKLPPPQDMGVEAGNPNRSSGLVKEALLGEEDDRREAFHDETSMWSGKTGSKKK